MEPFLISPNNLWNSSSMIATEAGRIRNVRVGDVYSNYAYYGESERETNARFWALDLSTGESTLLGQLPSVTGNGSWGLWTVKEVDGYLYVHTTHDGVFSYELLNATTLGTLQVHYTASSLAAVTGDPAPYWGFDVAKSGNLMLLSGFAQFHEIRRQTMVGDYNGDGIVSVADYHVWRSNFGFNTLSADGNHDGRVDGADYTVWRDNFIANISGLSAVESYEVPEPSAVWISILAGLTWIRVGRPCRAA